MSKFCVMPAYELNLDLFNESKNGDAVLLIVMGSRPYKHTVYGPPVALAMRIDALRTLSE